MRRLLAFLAAIGFVAGFTLAGASVWKREKAGRAACDGCVVGVRGMICF